MQLTYVGQVFLVVVAVLMIWSFVLTKFWVKRLAKNRKSSKFEFAYLFTVVFSISALFFPFTYWVSQAVYGLATKPTYDATVVSYTSEWVDTERTDSNGRKYKTKTLMYTAQVQFKDNQNRTLTLDNSVRSGDVPLVGEHITVVYESSDHTAQEKSWRTILLFAAALFMLFIIGYILVMIIAYALNRNMDPYTALAKFLIFRITLPLGTMAMFGMLSYSVFAYFFLFNPQNIPVWAAAICGFFSLCLLPLIYHILTGWKAYKK
ncbi:xanthine permease [Acinetobacter pittii]|uniref:xanthine permease n=1 Tax=Acinetobacter pittii TaxID=48296 RepID=UPI000992FAE4|nr:xanthine permease [Acinetobacter pittii]AQV14441.1 xanthine permease [Acinetobacter pittii]MBN6493291.1 xanthine permease [Acinetobacter pittii]OON25197.1 xanthine permease [Acinetobacter pittii]